MSQPGTAVRTATRRTRTGSLTGDHYPTPAKQRRGNNGGNGRGGGRGGGVTR